MFSIIGIVGGLIFILGDIPYVLDTIKGKTKPHRTTWLIFFLLDLIYLFNQYALGATSSLYLVFAWTIMTLLIFILSIKNGIGGFEKLDLICLVGAITGLILWWVLKTPLLSVFCNILVSLIGYIPTYKKVYLKPYTETEISWLTSAVAAILSAVSIGSLNIKLLILPMYSFITTFSVFAFIKLRKNKLANTKII